MNENINWDILLHELETGKCILCIGPDVFSESDKGRLERHLADKLRKKSTALGIRVYDDGWFHYLHQRDELATWFAIKQFYETELPAGADATFQEIAALPFHLLLNFSPDYRLRDIFVGAGKPHDFDCLYKNPDLDQSYATGVPKMDKAKPLIFNMLGKIEDKDSLVMTYDDLFGYMEAIFEKKRMPNHVELKIKQATHFIFIGMPLDKWYFHLFMRVLNMHKDITKTKRFQATYSVNGANATFCEEMYTLTFVQKGIAQFLSSLREKWHADQARRTNKTYLNIFDRWREHIKSGEDAAIRQVFKEMKPFTDKSNEITNALIMLVMQWNGFMSTLFESNMMKEAMKADIINRLLILINSIQEQNPNGQP